MPGLNPVVRLGGYGGGLIYEPSDVREGAGIRAVVARAALHDAEVALVVIDDLHLDVIGTGDFHRDIRSAGDDLTEIRKLTMEHLFRAYGSSPDEMATLLGLLASASFRRGRESLGAEVFRAIKPSLAG